MAAEGARAGNGLEQPQHMPGDGVEPRAAAKLALDIRNECLGRGLGRRIWCGGTIKLRVDREQPPRLLVGGAPHHHAVDMRQVRRRLVEIGDAAVDRDGKRRAPGLQPIDAVIIERRNVAVLARREPVEPGLARMHDERVDAGALDGAGERLKRLLRILRIDADATLDRDRHLHCGLHGRHAIADQRRLGHQAGAEAALLHPVGGAADVEVDLVVAEIGGDARAGRELLRLAAAELERHRMLGRVVGQKPRPVAMEHRAGRDHLGIDERAAREEPMEEPAVAVGPIHHGGDAERISFVFQCLAPRSPRRRVRQGAPADGNCDAYTCLGIPCTREPGQSPPTVCKAPLRSALRTQLCPSRASLPSGKI